VRQVRSGFLSSLIALFALAGAALACSPSTSAPLVPPDVSNVALDQDFELAPGQSATFAGVDFAVRFDSVSADSRCPSDVVCVWAGDAAVHLTLTRDGGGSRSAVLHTTLDPKNITEGNAVLAIVGLNPATRSTVRIRPHEYRVKLIVRGT
jgi:hypothetical protein